MYARWNEIPMVILDNPISIQDQKRRSIPNGQKNTKDTTPPGQVNPPDKIPG